MNTHVALVTGGTGNLGGAVARRFAQQGWKVIAPVRKLVGNPKAMALIDAGIDAVECNIEEYEEADILIRALASQNMIPSLVFQAAGMFLWDDGFPQAGTFTNPAEVTDYLLRANCATKENINRAIIELMPQQVGNMRNDMIGSHAGTWPADDPRRNGPFKEEGYVHSMQRVEAEGEKMRKYFHEVHVHHTPLINSPETRKAFPPERAPDITEVMWRAAPSPDGYAALLYPDSFFAP